MVKKGHAIMKPTGAKNLIIMILDWQSYFPKCKKNIPWIDRQMKNAKNKIVICVEKLNWHRRTRLHSV